MGGDGGGDLFSQAVAIVKLTARPRLSTFDAACKSAIIAPRH